MLHNVIWLQRRFPEHSTQIVVGLTILSVLGIAAGLFLLLG